MHLSSDGKRISNGFVVGLFAMYLENAAPNVISEHIKKYSLKDMKYDLTLYKLNRKAIPEDMRPVFNEFLKDASSLIKRLETRASLGN